MAEQCSSRLRAAVRHDRCQACKLTFLPLATRQSQARTWGQSCGATHTSLPNSVETRLFQFMWAVPWLPWLAQKAAALCYYHRSCGQPAVPRAADAAAQRRIFDSIDSAFASPAWHILEALAISCPENVGVCPMGQQQPHHLHVTSPRCIGQYCPSLVHPCSSFKLGSTPLLPSRTNSSLLLRTAQDVLHAASGHFQRSSPPDDGAGSPRRPGAEVFAPQLVHISKKERRLWQRRAACFAPLPRGLGVVAETDWTRALKVSRKALGGSRTTPTSPSLWSESQGRDVWMLGGPNILTPGEQHIVHTLFTSLVLVAVLILVAVPVLVDLDSLALFFEALSQAVQLCLACILGN